MSNRKNGTLMSALIKYPVKETWEVLLQRPTQSVEAIESVVNDVFLAVKQQGDMSIARYTKQFDKVELDSIVVSQKEIDDANDSVPVYLPSYLPKNPLQLSSTMTVLGNLFFNLGTFITLPIL